MASTYVPAIYNSPPSIPDHILLRITFSTPIILSSTIDKIFFEKNILPYLSPKDITSLCLFTATITYSIDYLQSYGYITHVMDFPREFDKILGLVSYYTFRIFS